MSDNSGKEPAAGGSPVCPIPISEYPRVVLGHGGGGRLSNTLIDRMFVPVFDNETLDTRHDGAVFRFGDAEMALSTDSYVVKPLFFPGGDIGSLAVHGTVNDLLMCGATPRYLSVGLVIEEGLPMDDLWRIVRSMKTAADSAGVTVVTGDTKVVERGKGDQVYINTTGVGPIDWPHPLRPDRIRPGDAIVLSGDIGRHGMAIMAAREGLQFEHTITSDSAPLTGPVVSLRCEGESVRCMRDLTRGGLAGVLHELAAGCGCEFDLDERRIPVQADVRAACEVLGIDPMHVANEGRFVAFVGGHKADRAVAALRADPAGTDAVVVGRVVDGEPGRVTATTAIGARRIVDAPSGDLLPRIC